MSLKDWTKQSGAFVIKELSADDAVLKHLTTGTKYLECTSAGKIAIPSKQAYGTWEFDLFCDVASYSVISFVSNSNNISYNTSEAYYQFIIGPTADIGIRKANTAFLMLTELNYISLKTWHRVKIIRENNGRFTIYIKGGSFGNTWTLVSTTGGSGTNPVTDNTYTTSNYFVAVLNPGDKIANIKFYDGVRQ